MIIPPSTGGVRQYSVPQWLGWAAVAMGVTVGVVLVVAVAVAIHGFSVATRYEEQRAENEDLRSAVREAQANVAALHEQLADLETMEQSVRLVFGLPEIDPEERALGTGGSLPVSGETADATQEATYALESDIDRLLRRCSFERENYGEILDSLTNRKTQLDHTPSLYPVRGYLSRGFGIKTDPFTGRKRMHNGLDLAARAGTPIYAPADGRVAVRRRQRQLGRMIVIDHGAGIRTYYGHLSKFAVKLNQRVQRGDVIGYVGSSGYSTAPHLHYEVHIDGHPVNPMKYIYDRAPMASAPLAISD